MTSLTRIQQHFHQQKAFIAYLTAGDGGIQKSLDAALALIDGGVNMLEIGIPFSDPIADGPVIQRAAARALHHGTTLKDILWLIQKIRQQSSIPLILFSYLNPLLSALATPFFKEAQQAGLDGVLVVDCPIEESGMIYKTCEDYHLAPIFIIATSTPDNRVHQLSTAGKGFLYYACQTGTTGVRQDLPANFEQQIQRIKARVNLPLVAGFGIGQKNIAEKVLQLCEGVVVGSFFVKAMEDGIHGKALSQLALRINPLTR